jgi:hypothetical protein
MDKTAQLKSIARGLAAGSILGAGAGIAAHEQIKKNNHNARTVKGWETRRRNTMIKEAEDSDRDTISEVKTAVRSLSGNMNNPTRAASNYISRRLLIKVKKMITKMRTPKYGNQHSSR